MQEKIKMSVETVRAELAIIAPDIEIIEKNTSTATVQEAATAHGVGPEQIAKTLSLSNGKEKFLVVTCGTARLDNRKAKDQFGGKVKMLAPEIVEEITSHPVGGVCPFGLKESLKIYLDISLKNFDEVVPAAGSINSALRINPVRMAELVKADWVDVCK